MIKELQQIIDSADPFLIEALSGKSIEELYHYLYKLDGDIEKIEKTRNSTWIQQTYETRRVARALYELSVLYHDDNKKGHSIV